MKKNILICLLVISSLNASENLTKDSFKKSFKNGCIQIELKDSENYCNCIWNKIDQKYTYEQLKEISILDENTKDLRKTDFGKNVLSFAESCIK